MQQCDNVSLCHQLDAQFASSNELLALASARPFKEQKCFCVFSTLCCCQNAHTHTHTHTLTIAHTHTHTCTHARTRHNKAHAAAARRCHIFAAPPFSILPQLTGADEAGYFRALEPSIGPQSSLLVCVWPWQRRRR